MGATGNSTSRRGKSATRNGRLRANRKDLAGSFRSALEALDFSYEDVSRRIPLSVRMVGAYARGERALSLETIKCDVELYARFIRCEYVAVMRGRR